MTGLTSAGLQFGGENSDAAKAHLMPCFSCSVSGPHRWFTRPRCPRSGLRFNLIVGGFRAM